MHYYDNPKGMIPSWLINWAAKVNTSYHILETLSELKVNTSLNTFLYCILYLEVTIACNFSFLIDWYAYIPGHHENSCEGIPAIH